MCKACPVISQCHNLEQASASLNPFAPQSASAIVCGSTRLAHMAPRAKASPPRRAKAQHGAATPSRSSVPNELAPVRLDVAALSSVYSSVYFGNRLSCLIMWGYQATGLRSTRVKGARPPSRAGEGRGRHRGQAR